MTVQLTSAEFITAVYVLWDQKTCGLGWPWVILLGLILAKAAPKCEACCTWRNTWCSLVSVRLILIPDSWVILGYAMYGYQGDNSLVTLPLWVTQINILVIQVKFINKSWPRVACPLQLYVCMWQMCHWISLHWAWGGAALWLIFVPQQLLAMTPLLRSPFLS